MAVMQKKTIGKVHPAWIFCSFFPPYSSPSPGPFPAARWALTHPWAACSPSFCTSEQLPQLIEMLSGCQEIQVLSDFICNHPPGCRSPAEQRITPSNVSFQIFNFNFLFLNLIPSFLHFTPREVISHPDIQREFALPSLIWLCY